MVLGTLISKFDIKVFKNLSYPNLLVDFDNIVHDRFWSKVLYSICLNHVHDMKVEVLGSELSCLCFQELALSRLLGAYSSYLANGLDLCSFHFVTSVL